MKGAFFSSLWGPGGARLLAGDLVVILVLALLSGIVFSLPGRAGGGGVDIEVSGRRDVRRPLADDGISEVSGPLGITRIELRNGRARILSSPCPLKLCQKAGWIGASGEMIVCLPNEVVVRIPGGLPGGVDALSQ